jgi:hypothetical protein
MADQLLGAARVFASHYQLVVCDDPARTIGDDENSDAQRSKSGLPERRHSEWLAPRLI